MRKLLMLAALVVGISFVGAGSVHAATFLTEDTSYLGGDQVVDGTLYAAGSTVTVAGTVKGDLFCAGQTVEITGTVEGDVICAGQQVRVSGPVGGDVRVAGQMVTISSQVSGSATAFGQTVTFDSVSQVGTDVTVGAQAAVMGGKVGRDISGGTESMTLSGPVGGSVALDAARLVLTSAARVEGTLSYTSPEDARMDQGAVVVGGAQRHEPSAKTYATEDESFAGRVAGAAFWLAALLCVGLAFMLVRPAALPASAQRVRQMPWQLLGWGLLGLFGPPILAILLMITVIGLPLAFVVLALWGVGLVMSVPVAGHAVGRLVLAQSNVKMGERWLQVASLALGLLLVLVLTMVPFVGPAVHFVAILLGLGALVELAKRMPGSSATNKVKGKLV